MMFFNRALPDEPKEQFVISNSANATFNKAVEWQPIDSAPRDGRRVLLVDTSGDIQICFWWCGNEIGPNNACAWCMDANDNEFDDPTHWMPLPDAPSVSDGNEVL